MSPDIRVGGSWRSIARGEVFLGGSWRTLTRGEVYKGGAWHPLFTFTSSLSVSVTPLPAVTYTSPPHPTSSIASLFMTAAPSGGLAPYTYLYSVVSSTGAVPVIGPPTNATTNISKTVPAFADITDSFNVTVTDALGATASASFSIEFINDPIGA